MTRKLKPLQLDDNTVIYIEASDDLDETSLDAITSADNDDEEEAATGKGLKEDFQKHIRDVQGVITAYTHYSLDALKKVAIANVDKVTLEFGIEIGGELGVPYITKGTTKSNLKIQVQCSFPNPAPKE
ncbi:MAG: hypothetical protein EAZ61_11990 [Oscillatoriales cyanobacterium]|nr:MAG: hypothetical protein EAZ61_11990 [Oscillatoriales cyanobacterium]